MGERCLCIGARARRIGVESQLREPEIEQLREPVLAQHDVLGLHITVDDARVVRRCQRGGDLPRDVERVVQGQAAGLQALAQRDALDELRHQYWGSVDIVDVVDRQDRRMVERGCRPGLQHEAPDPLLVAAERGREQLDRDPPPEPGVLRGIDFPHASTPEEYANPILLDERARDKSGTHATPVF